MKLTVKKALVLAVLMGLTSGLVGCASAAKEKCDREKYGERCEAPAPESAPAPHGGGDDMERLDKEAK